MWLVVSLQCHCKGGNLLGSDTGSDCELELLCLLKEISSEVSRVEGSGDQNLGLTRQLSSDSLKVGLRRESPSGRRSRIPPCRQ